MPSIARDTGFPSGMSRTSPTPTPPPTPKTKEVVKVLSPAQRGAILLRRLHISGAKTKKFVFVDGDIEKADLGIAPKELDRLEKTLTHVVHCAASVSFGDAYEKFFQANVQGARRAR